MSQTNDATDELAPTSKPAYFSQIGSPNESLKRPQEEEPQRSPKRAVLSADGGTRTDSDKVDSADNSESGFIVSPAAKHLQREPKKDGFNERRDRRDLSRDRSRNREIRDYRDHSRGSLSRNGSMHSNSTRDRDRDQNKDGAGLARAVSISRLASRDSYNFYIHEERLVVVRVLIESNYCPRLLGHGARTLQWLKQQCGPDFDAWISREVQSHQYRVIYAVGDPESVAKFFGLAVRKMFDEPEEPSGDNSRIYNMRILMPHFLMGRMIGLKMANFKEIEKKSAALLSAEHECLADSNERVVHVKGVSDAIHIALYYLLVQFYEHSKILKREPLRLWDERSDAFRYDTRPPISRPPLPPAEPIQAQQQQPQQQQIEIALPDLVGPRVAHLATAYEIAKDCTKETLRQIIRVPKQGNLEDLKSKISLVTDCSISVLDDDDDETATWQVEGSPEDNVLAIFLMYRHFRKFA